MRQVTKKGLITVVAAGGALALSGVAAYADADADGAAVNSPGVLSGNTVQAPVHVPVNVCGNTVNVVGGLNPAIGNKCANVGDDSHDDGHHDDGHHDSGAEADGAAVGSPGVLSGNTVQAPVSVPVNVCGNTVDVVGVLNPAIGNDCTNGGAPEGPGEERPEEPGGEEPGGEEPEGEKPEGEKPEGEKPEAEKPEAEKPGDTAGDGGETGVTPAGDRHEPQAELAETGASALTTVLPVGTALMLGGYVLYRRARVAAQR
ncbi:MULTISPECIES: chaplin [Streptomyces]|uniref:chaplin n=1 Tax=Streptomyces TaxID=1883 RepID=UPI002B0593F7|nr:chaplin [Streptomyces sp. JHD 1]